MIDIIVIPSECNSLRNWLFIFIPIELTKVYAQLKVRRSIRENELYLTGVPLVVRLFSFSINGVDFLWFIYGNSLYYQLENKDLFSYIFSSILIYGYGAMIKFIFEFVVIILIAPIFYCIGRPNIETIKPAGLPKVLLDIIS